MGWVVVQVEVEVGCVVVQVEGWVVVQVEVVPLVVVLVDQLQLG